MLNKDTQQLCQLLAQTNPAPPATMHSEILQVLDAHTIEYYSGKLSLRRLLEVVISPFLKLAAKENQAEAAESWTGPGSDEARELRALMASAWFQGVQNTITAQEIVEPSGETSYLTLISDDAKKAEFREALRRKNFAQASLSDLPCLLEHVQQVLRTPQ